MADANDLAAEVARLRQGITDIALTIATKVAACCGDEAGKQFCESFGCGSMMDVHDALLALSPAPSAPAATARGGWVSVAERLPGELDWVLLWCHGRAYTGWWTVLDGERWWQIAEDVQPFGSENAPTHWCAIPPPPSDAAADHVGPVRVACAECGRPTENAVGESAGLGLCARCKSTDAAAGKGGEK